MNTTDRAGTPGEPAPYPLGGFEERLLAELKFTVAGAATADPAVMRARARATRLVPLGLTAGLSRVGRRSRPPWLPSRSPRWGWPVRRLILAGGVIAAATAGAIALATVAGGPGGAAQRTQRPDRYGAVFVPPTSASAVLRNAALAALRTPAGAPRPDQFVYTKVYSEQPGQPVSVVQTWLSVSGTRYGWQQGGTVPSGAPWPACVNGWLKQPAAGGPKPIPSRCVPADVAGYLPALPTRSAALRVYLDQHFGVSHDPGGLASVTEEMLTTLYLTPVQRAAIYHVLAQTPGLALLPHVTNVAGRSGVGIRTGVYKGAVHVIIFGRKTYAPLGENWTGVLPSSKGQAGGEVLQRLALVNRVRQLP